MHISVQHDRARLARLPCNNSILYSEYLHVKFTSIPTSYLLDDRLDVLLTIPLLPPPPLIPLPYYINLPTSEAYPTYCSPLYSHLRAPVAILSCSQLIAPYRSTPPRSLQSSLRLVDHWLLLGPQGVKSIFIEHGLGNLRVFSIIGA